MCPVVSGMLTLYRLYKKTNMTTATVDRSRVWTVDDFLQLEESNLPCELINGELFMSPAPNLTHQLVAGNLYEIIKAYARKTGGIAMFSPVDVYLDQKNVFQPDLLYVRKENLSILKERGLEGAPDLAVEIISKFLNIDKYYNGIV